MQTQHIGIWNKNIHWNVFFIVFFVCICSKCSMYYTHSGPTIPFEDGELPQDTCRARGKADIRYSMDYHFEIRYSKDYHVETYCRWTWRLSWFQLAIQIWSWNGSSGKKGNTGPIYSAFLVKYKLFIDYEEVKVYISMKLVWFLR